jgi:penicillin-binding protein-related factor A (putative recombinase)
MKEKDIQTLFSKVINEVGVYELKLAKRSSMPYNQVADHQIEALLSASNETGLFHKITDMPWGTTNKFRFTKPKPFDCFFFRNTPAYVGICYYKPRQKKEVFCISIANFIKSKEEDSRKSITETRAREIADFVVNV